MQMAMILWVCAVSGYVVPPKTLRAWADLMVPQFDSFVLEEATVAIWSLGQLGIRHDGLLLAGIQAVHSNLSLCNPMHASNLLHGYAKLGLMPPIDLAMDIVNAIIPKVSSLLLFSQCTTICLDTLIP